MVMAMTCAAEGEDEVEEEDDDDDDDDWGEMVSAPTLPVLGTNSQTKPVSKGVTSIMLPSSRPLTPQESQSDEDDEVIQRILSEIPDLSYMLRQSMDRIRNEKGQLHTRSSGQGIETETVGEADGDVEGRCTTDFDFKRLGWQRPPEFKNAWVEACFVLSSVGALAMADFIVDGFQVLLPALIDPLSIPPGAQIWPSSVVTMVAGSCLFPLGRLTDMYGGYLIFNGGLTWFTLWTLAAGFATNFIFLVFCRAMQGLGMAAFLPAGIALLGRFYRPGPRKNLVFALYGAACPVGFFSGVLTAGFSQEVLGQWRWFFWVGGMQMVLKVSSLTTALWYAPWAVSGLIFSTLGGLVLDRIPASWLLIPSSISAIMAVLLFAVMPSEPSYWLWIFPAMIFEAASADILWTVSNVFLTTSLPRHHQGLAGAIISLTLFVGDALFLAVGDVVEESMAGAGSGAETQYKAVFWVAVVIGLAALGTNFFIRIPEASAELTVDERDELEWKRGKEDSMTDAETVVGCEMENLLKGSCGEEGEELE
ncbi:hypothetical protein CDD80_591 [Ophiocordyceps camponoti-rufipedis]|uniref:Major facilitator superfamily (MFS) profile domain-containing protein n=1 Tax=Ophiocordyceps camponoti-rufipedis TaxID=2004952 RepID=A0A2C5YDW9_9HYPO|nr:hypothetical protein CDD80_591 [Ophiocordyceps camponoti-rufipedis]